MFSPKFFWSRKIFFDFFDTLFGFFFDEEFFDQNVLDKTVGISNGEGKTLIPEGFTYPSHWVDIEEIRTDFETRTGEKLGVVETYEALLKEWGEEHA